MTGCAYYGDIHSHSRPLSSRALSQAHVYPSSPVPPLASHNWWARFKDTQLDELIQVALHDAPTLKMAENRLGRSQHLADEASSALWPSVEFSGYVQRQRFSTFGLVPPPFNGRTYNIGMLGLNFNYEFDFWGKNRQFLIASLNEACASQSELLAARLIISTAVASTYFQLRYDITQTHLADTQWKISQKLLKIASDRARHGINSDIPVKEIQARAQAQKISLEFYKQETLLARHQLAVLIGKNPFTTEIMARPFAEQNYQVNLPALLPANLLANRPDIYAAKYRMLAAANRINVAKAYFFPDINLNALLSYQSVGLGHLFDSQSHNNAITGAVDLPVFDAGARRANLRVKYDEYDLSVNEYNQRVLKALQEVSDQLAILKAVKAQQVAQHSAFSATKKNYQLFRSRYRHGISDYADVLIAQQSYTESLGQLTTLETQHVQAVIGMLKALGGSDVNEGARV